MDTFITVVTIIGAVSAALYIYEFIEHRWPKRPQ